MRFINILLFIVAVGTSGCVTFKKPSVLDGAVKPVELLCVDLKIKYVDEGIFGVRQIADLPETSKIRLLRSLSAFGVQTNCGNPQAKLDILLEDKNKIGIFNGLWGAVSFFTLGIVPFVHSEDVLISISKQNEILTEDSFEAKKVVSIIYVVKMHSEDTKALDKFKIPTRSEAEFGYAVANGVRKAVAKTSFKASN